MYQINEDIIIILLLTILLLLLLLHVLWKKKVKLQYFVHVCSLTNKLPWNWSWHIKHLYYPCWLFFEPCTIARVQLPPPLKPNQGESRLCHAAVNIVFLCTFAYFFCFSLTPENVTCWLLLQKTSAVILDSLARL